MKPNPRTGELTLPGGTILSPRLTRSRFLASAEGRLAAVSVQNEPWCSFRFEDREDSLGVVVFFKGETLESVHVSITDPRFGRGRDDWSEQGKRKRKQANDDWLRRNGLRAGTAYSWGSVWSDYSPKSGCSLIVIRYGRDRQ